MRKAEVYQQGVLAGVLAETDGGDYRFEYCDGFSGEPVSLTMPTAQRAYAFEDFPSVFEGLLPEGGQLEALLRRNKIDRSDLFAQLMAVGGDVVGSLQIKEIA
ncbi:MAG: HipA N-terminal domain-containing protein [Chthoniobacterales bacterium]